MQAFRFTEQLVFERIGQRLRDAGARTCRQRHLCKHRVSCRGPYPDAPATQHHRQLPELHDHSMAHVFLSTAPPPGNRLGILRPASRQPQAQDPAVLDSEAQGIIFRRCVHDGRMTG